MVCFIHLHETLNLLVIVIVIVLEIVMIGFVFCLDELKQHLHSLLRNNLLIVALSTCETDYVAVASCVCYFIRERACEEKTT